MNEIIRSIESAQLKTNIPAFNVGDTVRVQVKVV
ncbi:MAG: 50S ribosomal protein L19, partial [Clostridia bacterium]|nr:50S ribosomal protein L19 [Clostridia bacterium]